MLIVFSAEELLSLGHTRPPSRGTRKTIFGLHLWRPRSPTAEGNTLRRCSPVTSPRMSTTAVSPSTSTSTVSFGCLNIRSISNKLDDLLEVRRNRSIDILCLVETWHDDDCVSFRRLRVDGFHVVDRPRPRNDLVGSDLSTNHGGVAIVAAPGVHLSPVTVVGCTPTTFELVCAQVAVGRFASIVAVIYRPGSSAVQSAFFDELSAVLDVVAAYQEPIYIAGDFNIRLDRVDDPHTIHLHDIVESYGLAVRPTAPTHRLGGTIDAVITRRDISGPDVISVDVDLSDHHLLQWSVAADLSSSPVESVVRRPWRSLDIDAFRLALRTSPICRPDVWPVDIDDFAVTYDRELTSILDRLIPFRQITRRPRPSDSWFDCECRDAKRLTRRLERAYSAAVKRASAVVSVSAVVVSSDAVNDAVRTAEAAWRNQRRCYRDLRQQKRCAFWKSTIEADRDSPRRLWRSVDTLLGRGRPPVSSAISVDDFSQYFIDKVAAVRSNTDVASEPSFTSCAEGQSLTAFDDISTNDVADAI